MAYSSFLKTRRCLALSGLAFFSVLLITAISRPALACGICDMMTNSSADQQIEQYMEQEHQNTQEEVNNHTDERMQEYEDWLTDDYFQDRILQAMGWMAEQMSAVAMQQMGILGTFLDAKHQLESERLFGQLAAQAHKDYHPSEGMCTIGTAARSLAGSDRTAEMTALVLARRSQERQLLNVNASSHGGRGDDRLSRAEQFKTTYCDVHDNNRGLNGVCATNPAPTNARKNKDIDYAKTLWSPLTLDINFSSAVATSDATDILALESNLYSHSVFESPISSTMLRGNISNQQVYMDMRSIVAKRSVAENSFQALAAMKTAGRNTSGSAQYLQAAIQQLNGDITQAQASELIGANPSYYAQMEILTKKILQNPQFFTDLYDKPANVARKGVALQAISLMQDRDFYKSNVRSEAILSVLLEMEVINAQKKVQDEIDRLK